MATNKTSRAKHNGRPLPIGTEHSAALIEVGRPSPSQPSHLPLSSLADGNKPAIRLIPIQTVQEILGVKRSFINERVANKEMPLPVKFGTSRRAAVRWFEHEILEFVMKLAAERDQCEE
jgi:predicted DNA-binding transcriptional regulator AlpA